MTLNERALKLIMTGATVLSFVLLLFASDLGASQTSIISDACAVSVLGAMTFTLLIADRLSG